MKREFPNARHERNNAKSVGYYLPLEVIAKIEAYAKEHNISKCSAVTALIQSSVK